MGKVDDRLRVFDHAVEVRLLEDDRGGRLAQRFFEPMAVDAPIRPGIYPHDVVALGIRVCLQNLGIFRVQSPGDHHVLASRLPDRHMGGLGKSGGAVIERGIRNVETGEQRDHGLEFVGGLQDPLTHFRLVGRVGRVEVRA